MSIQPTSGAPVDSKYNLVEKKKRKNRGNKKNGPQEGMIFHLKLEEEKKSKRQKNSSNQQKNQQGSTSKGFLPTNSFQNDHQSGHPQSFGMPTYLPNDPSQYYPPQYTYQSTMDHSHTVILENVKENSMVTAILGKIDSLSSPSILTCTDGCIIKVNDAFCKMVGYTTEELESTMLQNVMHPDDKNSSNTLILQMIASNSESVVHDVRMVTPEGRVILAIQEVCGIRNMHGNFQWLVYKINKSDSMEEIVRHDRMRIQLCYCNHKTSNQSLVVDEISQSFETMYTNLLERFFHVSQPCCFYDKQATILWNNDAFDLLFGGKPKQFIHKKTTEIEEMKGTAMDILAKSVLEEQPEKLECQFVPQLNVPIKKMAVKCSGQRIDLANVVLYGYLWIFEILDPNESSENQIVLKEDLNM